MMHQIEQVCLFEVKDYAGFMASCQDYLKRIRSGQQGYTKNRLPRVYASMGISRLAMKELKGAKDYFLKCLAYMGERDRPSLWGLWGVIRLAQVEDALGDRAEAIKYYQEILLYKDFWGYHSLVQPCLKHPCKPDYSNLQLLPMN
jgi:tetratricopeptide (TPR) repeat protein